MSEPLVDEFVRQQVVVESAVRSGESSVALEEYKKLYNIYSSIASSDIGDVHKSIAFDQVSSVYQSLQSLNGSSLTSSGVAAFKTSSVNALTNIVAERSGFSRVTSFSPRDIAIASTFIFLALGVLLVNPSTVGFSFFGSDNSVDIVKPLGVSFDRNTELLVPLSRPPASISLSGNISSGFAKVFVYDSNKKLLVVDTSSDGNSFSSVCGSACSLKTVLKDFSLFVEVSGGVLTLDELEFSPRDG
ncbi:hypothetical protein HY483_01865 [Candidatus Woesearchaeota archaeon]|nr:hypothetical protein [Candidatus Woesearchaeota archaeon]